MMNTSPETHAEFETPYERTVEIFGRTFGYRVEPHQMEGLSGWTVRTEGRVLDAWFLSHEHACRWVDVMIGHLS